MNITIDPITPIKASRSVRSGGSLSASGPAPVDPNALAFNFPTITIPQAPEIAPRPAIKPNTPKILELNIRIEEEPLNYTADILLGYGFTDENGNYTKLPFRRNVRINNIFSVGTVAQHPELDQLAPALFGGLMQMLGRLQDHNNVPVLLPPAEAVAGFNG